MGDDDGAPAADEKLDFLLHRAWPDDLPEVVETHMSWVFLTRGRAWKMKKPVRVPPVDYRTIEDRRVDCEAEVTLNQALAPGVYLGTSPLTRDPAGTLHVGPVPGGQVVDWLVVMHRLPREAMLDRRIARHDVDPADVDALVAHLCAFYRAAPAQPLPAPAYRVALAAQVATDQRGLVDQRFGLDAAAVCAIADSLRRAIATMPDIAARAGRVVEGHGDLRPEHVVLGADGSLDGGRPLVIDRLSFDRRLRLVDPLFDLALLAVECEHLDDPALGDRIMRVYRAQAPDEAPPPIDALYRSVRALTRARLSIEHLRDGGDREGEWRRRTASYLAIAARHGAAAPGGLSGPDRPPCEERSP